ncbi:MAG: glycosyltransferase family 4 protein [Deltaproteobacteria bacterium]|nr:glycosyltransferase family 4 protein [Deltaproteobacteria bacterium]
MKLCEALQLHFDAQFWFYTDLEPGRPDFWRVTLGDKCRILTPVLGKKRRRYVAPLLQLELGRFDPDIVMLGGATIPSNYFAYRWAKKHDRRTILFTELSRDKTGEARPPGLLWRLLKRAYLGLDAIFTSSAEAAAQFRDSLQFGDRVFPAQYPADIAQHFSHQRRGARSSYRVLFPNRLIEIYNPIFAIECFAELTRRHPNTRLVMNAEGPLLEECRRQVSKSGLDDKVEFLDAIQRWDDLPAVYERSDILFLPALFSGGNLSILEGMASGMGTVISDRVLGTGKLVTDGQNGFVRRVDLTEMVDALSKYIEEPELLGLHGDAARVTARPFSVEATAQMYSDLISSHVLRDSAPK